MGSIQQRCNYCAKTIRSHIHHCTRCQVLVYTAEWTVATWGDQTCQRFEATAVGFETGFSRLRVWHSNRYAIMPRSVSVRIDVLWLDCTLLGLKCLTAAAIDSASISHGNDVICWPRDFALKNPASFSVPFCVAYIVARMQRCFTDLSVTVQSSSLCSYGDCPVHVWSGWCRCYEIARYHRRRCDWWVCLTVCLWRHRAQTLREFHRNVHFV